MAFIVCPLTSNFKEILDEGKQRKMLDWQTIKLVIRVPEDTKYLSYGVWMTGRGKVMLQNEKFEILQEDEEKGETLTNTDFYKWTGGNTWKKEPPVPA